jgi:hypothetical protein
MRFGAITSRRMPPNDSAKPQIPRPGPARLAFGPPTRTGAPAGST